MTGTPYQLEAGTGATATLGLIVLQVDETIERDTRRCLALDCLAFHITRIASGEDLTADTISTMEQALPAAAALLPQTPEYDVVGYGCTSGTTLIGADRVAALVQSGCRAKAVTDPLTAAIAAFRQLDVRSIGLVSPYIDEIAGPVKQAFEVAGIAVPRAISFGEKSEANVARITPTSVSKAAEGLARYDDVEAVFLSCTNLRTLDIIPDLERRFSKPVISSNLALCWHMARLSGVWRSRENCGGLFESSAI